jgi:hypothetical protein
VLKQMWINQFGGLLCMDGITGHVVTFKPNHKEEASLKLTRLSGWSSHILGISTRILQGIMRDRASLLLRVYSSHASFSAYFHAILYRIDRFVCSFAPLPSQVKKTQSLAGKML